MIDLLPLRQFFNNSEVILAGFDAKNHSTKTRTLFCLNKVTLVKLFCSDCKRFCEKPGEINALWKRDQVIFIFFFLCYSCSRRVLAIMEDNDVFPLNHCVGCHDHAKTEERSCRPNLFLTVKYN